MSVMRIVEIYEEYIPVERDMKSSSEGKVMVPLYSIPMMTDERWNELVRQQRRAVTA